MKLLDEKGIHAVVMEFNAGILRSEVPEDWLHGYLQQLPKPRKVT